MIFVNKYDVGQFAKVKGAWYEIKNIRFGMFGGGTDYFLSGNGRKGWIKENWIEEVAESKCEVRSEKIK